MPNILAVTLTEKSQVSNPRFIFKFTPDFSPTSTPTSINFTLNDLSPYPRRYNLFAITIGTQSGQVNLPVGWGNYEIYEQPQTDPVDLDITGRILERGRWFVGPQNINFY